MRNIVAGGIISLLLIFGGLALFGFLVVEAYLTGGNMPFWVKKGMSWFAVGLGSVLSIGITIGGGYLAWYVHWLLSHEVELYEDGFCFIVSSSNEQVRWNMIEEVCEIIFHEWPPILHAPASFLLPKFASSRFLVVVNDGKEFEFDGNSVKQIKRFGEILRARSIQDGIPWKTTEIHD